ncbi:unnamed protein product [Angiostrongylus costaricensis]|uniref:Metalloendopeptidase n=1 Tax=Angiostrongylus costaricensis TaxID=334426 RepID=A0A0R3PRW9_ANGCS|nr:unnamed protein product [Angiostrongylus costaricensis]
MLYSEELTNERSSSEESFVEKLQEAYQLLKDEPNAYDTMELPRKVHSMKDEINDKYIASEQPKVCRKRACAGFSAAEINMDSKVGFALFQEDMMLTGQQTEEIWEDIIDSEGSRKKRQAYRDEKYPKTLWSNGINYAFWNATDDVVWVIYGASSWSHLGRIGGVQILSLGILTGLELHELGYAIGRYHTPAKHDRDNFIEVRLKNVLDGWKDQFAKESERTNYNYNITYDYGTVMHYGTTALAKFSVF